MKRSRPAPARTRHRAHRRRRDSLRGDSGWAARGRRCSPRLGAGGSVEYLTRRADRTAGPAGRRARARQRAADPEAAPTGRLQRPGGGVRRLGRRPLDRRTHPRPDQPALELPADGHHACGPRREAPDDLRTRRLLTEPVVDPREASEPVNGLPVTARRAPTDAGPTRCGRSASTSSARRPEGRGLGPAPRGRSGGRNAPHGRVGDRVLASVDTRTWRVTEAGGRRQAARRSAATGDWTPWSRARRGRRSSSSRPPGAGGPTWREATP
jgi:hypothetical protein